MGGGEGGGGGMGQNGETEKERENKRGANNSLRGKFEVCWSLLGHGQDG